ncbi:25589_t:CDS:2, partial [Gigaspora margarita]
IVCKNNEDEASHLNSLLLEEIHYDIGAYSISTLGTPYTIDINLFKWIQAPTVITKELNDSMGNTFDSLGIFTSIQMNHLYSWAKRTKDDINKIAFIPISMIKTIKELD